MSMTQKEADERAKAITDEFLLIHNTESTLDGHFNSDELRQIADLMDEMSMTVVQP